MENRLKEGLENGEFVVTVEMIPGRGSNTPSQQKMLEESKKVFETGRVHAVSITDNPGGNPALSAEAFAQDMIDEGITPLIHMSCKDRNRNALMNALYAMKRRGTYNVLAMTGDYPVSGWSGQARPTFDLDPVHLLQMITAMNDGLKVTGAGEAVAAANADVEEPCEFFAGACISPFKYNEGEQLPQYFKLEKKIHAGAKFVISQVGYDARKMQELIMYLNDNGHSDLPAIANIYVLSYGAARFMHNDGVPGVYISDEFLEVLKQEKDNSEDKGKEARLIRAAKMIAIARGLGYRGVHIGSPGLTSDMVIHMLDLADELQDRWQEWAREISYGRPGGYFYYKLDENTGLNLHELADRPEQHLEKSVQKNYGLSRFAHHVALSPNGAFFGMFHRVMLGKERKWDEKYGAGKGRQRPHGFEHINKTNLYGCQDCGDCGLYATGYVCPMTQCPKCQRNGPCGGSNDGWCEVYPGVRRCIYYRAYYRLKKYGEEYSLGDWIVPPNNWTTFENSPWANYHLGRDGIARRERITPWREGEVKEAPYYMWRDRFGWAKNDPDPEPGYFDPENPNPMNV